jgi:hypothetical protein
MNAARRTRRTLLSSIAACSLLLLVAAAVPAGASARTTSTAIPIGSSPGTLMTFVGRGFGANQQATLALGIPRSEATIVARATANRNGIVRFRYRLPARIRAGKFIAVICQRGCRVRSSTPFWVNTSFDFEPGVGFPDDAQLGWTRARLLRAWGAANVNSPNYLSWQPAGAQVDAYLTGGVVATWGLFGTRHCTTWNFCIGDPASELQAYYGAALTRYEAVDERGWLVTSTALGYPTYTVFNVVDFEPGTRVSQVFIGRCSDTDYC